MARRSLEERVAEERKRGWDYEFSGWLTLTIAVNCYILHGVARLADGRGFGVGAALLWVFFAAFAILCFKLSRTVRLFDRYLTRLEARPRGERDGVAGDDGPGGASQPGPRTRGGGRNVPARQGGAGALAAKARLRVRRPSFWSRAAPLAILAAVLVINWLTIPYCHPRFPMMRHPIVQIAWTVATILIGVHLLYRARPWISVLFSVAIACAYLGLLAYLGG